MSVIDFYRLIDINQIKFTDLSIDKSVPIFIDWLRRDIINK